MNFQHLSDNRSPQPQKKMKFEDFELLSILGNGSYGKVYQVRKKQQEQCQASFVSEESKVSYDCQDGPQMCSKKFALKVIDKKIIKLEENHHQIHTEKIVLQSLKSPLIIEFFSSFQDHMRLYFLLEVMPNGSLQDFIKRERRLSLNLARHLTAEIILGLKVLKEN